MEKQKKKLRKIIFSLETPTYISWKDLKHINFEDDDIFEIDWDDVIGSCLIEIVRLVEESDEEFQKRIDWEESLNRL